LVFQMEFPIHKGKMRSRCLISFCRISVFFNLPAFHVEFVPGLGDSRVMEWLM
jgi:hypothetical protein